MEEEAQERAAVRAANQGAAAAPIIEATVNLDEAEQERLYAEHFNAQEGTRME